MIPYRDENPTEKPPIVTVSLIAINVLVWILFRLQGPLVYQKAVFELGMIPYEVWNGVDLSFADFISRHFRYFGSLPGSPSPISPYLSIFTSMFMHGGFFHLAGNMLYLWIFGNNVEDYLGHFRFLIFYLLCGLGAAFTHLIFNPSSQIPTVGASGAISGVLGAYLVLFPWARVYVLVPIFYFLTTITLPASVMIGLWFIFQLISAIPSTAMGGGGVAYWAHIGGFVVGYLWIWRRKRAHPAPRPYSLRSRYYRGFGR